jgi:hypothetical protein
MTTEFNDTLHWGIFTTGQTLTSSTGKMVRQSELVLAALRAQGVFDNLVDDTTAPAHDKLWLDKNSDPAVLKEWDSVSSAWQTMTFDRLFGRATVTDLPNVGGTANAITADEPSPFLDGKIYGLIPTAGNTGATTIQIAGVTTYDIVYPNGDALAKGELAADLRTPLLFANGRFEIIFGANAGSIKRAEVDASSFSFTAGKDATPADTSKVLPTVERVDAETVYKVADRTAMKALVGSKHLAVYLMETGREGIFKWNSSDLSTLVTADVQEGIYVAPSSDATGASGAWVRADFLAGKAVSPLWFGAALDGTADDYAAAQAAIDMISDTDGAEFIVPFGVMRISQSLNWGKLRATFNCIGRIMPHGSMDDFLVKFDFANVPGQIVNNNVAYRPNIIRLDLDGEWKSRGVHFKQPYLSLFQRIYVARPYGTALEIDGGFECQFAGTALTLGKDREADWLAGAAAWDDATAYAVGDHIYIEYPAWAVGTTYAVSDYVTRNSRAYRCIVGNVGNDPEVAGSADYWVHVGYEYYECLAANTDKSPPVGYTANNSVSANRYWRMVPAHEPLLKIDNSQESNMLIDNMHFTGLMIRDSDNRLAVWVDSNANDHMTININFHECQIHGMTPGMQAELESEYGETVLTDDGPDRRMVYLGRVARSSFVQCYVRPVSYDGGIGIQIGASDPLKITSGIGAELLEISGEGDRQVGIHVMTSIADPTTFFMGQISNFIVGTGARFLADPGQRLSGRVGTPQRFASGSTALPGIAWADDRTFGWLKSGTLMLLYQAAQQIMRAGMVSGTPYVDLPAKIHAGSLPGAADDTAAAAAGVEIGEFYRNGTSVQQRQV